VVAAAFLISMVVVSLLFSGEHYAILYMSTYAWSFILTLTMAAYYAFTKGRTRHKISVFVLLLNFAGSNYAWTTENPVAVTMALDVATAAFFGFVASVRFELALGAIYLLAVLVGVLTLFSLIPDVHARTFVYLTWAHPDVLTILGHVANVIIGISSGDSGRGARKWFERPIGISWSRRIHNISVFAYKKMAFMATQAKG